MPHSPPVQRRSQKTLERLVSATITLLEDHRPADVSVQEIVSLANSSVGSFYARFSGKEDLLEYVRTRMWSDATERWRQARADRQWEGLTLPDLIRGLVDLFNQVEGLHLRARRALGGSTSDPAALAFNEEVESGAVDLLLDRRSEIGHTDPDRVARFAVRLCLAYVRQERSLHPTMNPDPDSLHELATALVSYLHGSPGLLPGGDVEFFDVWA